MSTKIYDAYRLAARTDLDEFLVQLPAVMNPIHDRLDAKALAEGTVFGIDRLDYRGDPRPQSPIKHYADEWVAEQQGMDPSYRLQDPHRFQMFFATDPTDGRVLVRLEVEEDDYRNAFEALPGVESYSYWNNSDRPEILTADQWDERRQAWDRVLALGPMGSWELRPDFIPGMLKLAAGEPESESLLLANAPGLERRAKRLSQEVYLEWLIRETGAVGHEVLYLVSRAARANRLPLNEAILPLLAAPTAELLNGGTGDHGLASLAATDELCRSIFEKGDGETEEYGLSV